MCEQLSQEMCNLQTIMHTIYHRLIEVDLRNMFMHHFCVCWYYSTLHLWIIEHEADSSGEAAVKWLQVLLTVAKELCDYNCLQIEQRMTYVCLIKTKTERLMSFIRDVSFSPDSKHVYPP